MNRLCRSAVAALCHARHHARDPLRRRRSGADDSWDDLSRLGVRLVGRGAARRDDHADQRRPPARSRPLWPTRAACFCSRRSPVGSYKVEITLSGLQDRHVHEGRRRRRPGVFADRAPRAWRPQRERDRRGRRLARPHDDARSHDHRSSSSRSLALPFNGRNPISLVQLQAGVASLGRTNTGDQRRTADVDGGHAGRHQHPGQFHPHQLAWTSSPTVPRPIVSREFSIVTSGAGRGRRRRRVAGADDHAVGHQQIPAATSSSSTATRASPPTPSSTSARTCRSATSIATSSAAATVVRSSATSCSSTPTTKRSGRSSQTAQNYTIPARADLLHRQFPVPRRQTMVRQRQRHAAGRSDDRSRGAAADPLALPGSERGQQL